LAGCFEEIEEPATGIAVTGLKKNEVKGLCLKDLKDLKAKNYLFQAIDCSKTILCTLTSKHLGFHKKIEVLQ